MKGIHDLKFTIWIEVFQKCSAHIKKDMNDIKEKNVPLGEFEDHSILPPIIAMY